MTSAVYDGSISGASGLAGADAKCAALASAAGLPAGTYKAWLSTSSVDAASRLGTARGFVRTDKAPFADTVSDLTSFKILNPLVLDEAGNDIRKPATNEIAWTGSNSAGTVVASTTCMDWTSASSMDSGEIGNFDSGPSFWSDTGSVDCADSFEVHLYCFDTSHTSTLTYTRVTGRLAFISFGNLDTTAGVAGADSLCQSEATSAGLPKPSTFLALLSTSTAPAASRFDLSIGSMPYVRPDGIKIADAPTIASGGALDSGIWQYADGEYFNPNISFTSSWTGSTTPNVTGTATCNDWSTKSSSFTGLFGFSQTTEPTWWDSTVQGCNVSKPVYCLEQ